ncbi:MAG: Hpt domain-containing protein [Planctomycetota bacterium]
MAHDNVVPDGPIASTLVLEDPSFTDLVEQFIDALPERIANMIRATRAADFDALRVAAHQLKGSGGGYGYSVLTECAAKLEGSAKKQAMDDCIKSLEELQNLCARVVVTSTRKLG